MIGQFVTIWLAYANVFIAAFILIYAYLFLRKTQEHRDRRPWDFLFLASFFYLLSQVFVVIVRSGVEVPGINLDIVSGVLAFLYSGCVLLAFVSQHDLILRSQLILISKKDEKHPTKEAEKDVEVTIGMPDKKRKK
jgi:hypothetical protein